MVMGRCLSGSAAPAPFGIKPMRPNATASGQTPVASIRLSISTSLLEPLEALEVAHHPRTKPPLLLRVPSAHKGLQVLTSDGLHLLRPSALAEMLAVGLLKATQLATGPFSSQNIPSHTRSWMSRTSPMLAVSSTPVASLARKADLCWALSLTHAKAVRLVPWRLRRKPFSHSTILWFAILASCWRRSSFDRASSLMIVGRVGSYLPTSSSAIRLSST